MGLPKVAQNDCDRDRSRDDKMGHLFSPCEVANFGAATDYHVVPHLWNPRNGPLSPFKKVVPKMAHFKSEE